MLQSPTPGSRTLQQPATCAVGRRRARRDTMSRRGGSRVAARRRGALPIIRRHLSPGPA
ncbi:MAG: hypothetical protein MZW92_63430 [Comamonadaceae bacterium]|nr:hypothetical protein [Comamonadaceae bacterium]